MGYHHSETVLAAAGQLHEELAAKSIDLLIDDRNERPGSMFADMELIGIPHRFTIGDKGLAEGKIEYVARAGGEMEKIAQDGAVDFIRARLVQ